jgi:hypothetical protein
MAGWTGDELARIENDDELKIASYRKDGTLRPYRIIWAVQVGQDLYVRSVNGRDATWFRGTRTRHEGRVQAGGVEKDATFVDIDDPDLNEQIDAAYRTKYRRYAKSIIDHITSPQARAATLRLVPL